MDAKPHHCLAEFFALFPHRSQKYDPYDPVSLAGLAAVGVGRGIAIGFLTIPAIMVATNSATSRRMTDNMDIIAGRIADGKSTIQQILGARQELPPFA